MRKRKTEEIAEFFKILSTPSRIQLLFLLLEKESSVTELANEMGVTQSAVSHQLNILKNSGIVTGKRQGKQIFYILSNSDMRKLLSNEKYVFKSEKVI